MNIVKAIPTLDFDNKIYLILSSCLSVLCSFLQFLVLLNKCSCYIIFYKQYSPHSKNRQLRLITCQHNPEAMSHGNFTIKLLLENIVILDIDICCHFTPANFFFNSQLILNYNLRNFFFKEDPTYTQIKFCIDCGSDSFKSRMTYVIQIVQTVAMVIRSE